ncbi:MAG: PQQ-binding-like beta-propeller repeat protein [Phycisphaerales bacterium]|nr:MAG: PQQ-binding-like beta-propeller repeat protein [Phycisphaerales bacterium]
MAHKEDYAFMYKVSFVLILAVSSTFSDVYGSNWPQFRGPGGLGVAETNSLPTNWSDGENIAWKATIPGAGASSPVIYGNRVFLTCFTGYGVDGTPSGNLDDLKRHLLCLDAGSGGLLWQKEAETVLPESETSRFLGYASSTPAADADRVYCFFGKSGVIAFDHSGNQLWHRSVGDNTHGWGSAASPVLYKDLVIINAFVECGQLIALDKTSGREVWRAGDLKESWNTPLLVDLPDGNTELVIAISGKILGFDPATGQQLWECTGHRWYIVPSLIADNGVVYCLSGKGVEAIKAVRAGGRGDVSDTHVLWTVKKGTNVPSAVYYEGYIYFAHDTKEIAYCLNAATGDVVYEERLPRIGGVYASAVVGAGKIYYVSRGGGTCVLAAKPQYELLAHNRLEGDRKANASPAVNGQRLVLRMDRFLYCIGQPTLTGDANVDFRVDFRDYAAIAGSWLRNDVPACCGADISCDGQIDYGDLNYLVLHWLDRLWF